METLENRCEIEYRRFAVRRSLMTVPIRRAGLDCTSSEACISLEGEIACWNPKNDDFHIADGSKGNFRTGDYILPDGQTGNLFTGPDPTPLSSTAAGASRTTVRSSNVASSTRSVSPIDAADVTAAGASPTTLADSAPKSSNPTATSPAAATTASNSATSTPNSGHQKRGRGQWVGAAVGLAGLLAL
ncbi:hypothetical protein VTL71DRAFT_2461 [Oculimacula yallundae]|uniref:Uncharacterized protein n=1 Tax=Oculimacula yallundae TaxID=86028 RepID=A0ABR4C8Y4_9HELO